MGMSSSQARLLTLTSRQHDVEWRAQKLQADKLRLSSDSDRVYNTYLTALSATKIQARVFDQWNGDTFKDATLAMLINGLIPEGNANYVAGDYAAKPLFLQEISTGRIMITPEYAKLQGLTDTDQLPTLEEFLRNEGFEPDKPVTVKVPTGNMVPDTDVVIGFTPVENEGFRAFEREYGFEGALDNVIGGVDYDALKTYAEFDSTHQSVSGTSVADVTTFTSGQTYTIGSAQELQKLMLLTQAGASTSGVNFVLTGDIDLEGIDWSGISNFQGTFDGNGYTIKNLTGSQGLFETAIGATIENVNLENIDITGNNKYVGGLIGYAEDTNIMNISTSGNITNSNSDEFTHESTSHNDDIGTGGLVGFYYASGGQTSIIDNVMSSVDVDSAGYNVGGLLGCYFIQHPGSHPNFNNAYSIGDVNGNTNVGGITGYWKVDPDNHSNTDASNMYTGGNVSGDTNVGGFTGVLSCWDDNDDTFTFTGIDTSSKVTGDANVGVLIGNNNAVTDSTNAEFIDSGYAAGVNPGMDMVGKVTSGTATIPPSGGGVEEFDLAAQVPSINADGTGGFYSNVYAALIKAGMFDPAEMSEAELAVIDNQVKFFILSFQDNDVDNEKLYHLNSKLFDYLTGNDDEAFATALVNDIVNGTNTETASYQTGTSPMGKIKRFNGEDDSWIPSMTETNGYLMVPSEDTIKANIIAAVKKEGVALYEEDIQNFLDLYDSENSKEDRASLAYINDMLSEYSKNNTSIDDLLKAIKNNQKIENIPDYIDNLDHYDIEMDTNDRSDEVVYEHPLKEETIDEIELVWDWGRADIQEAISRYRLLGNGFIIIGDGNDTVDYESKDAHKNSNWLTNVIKSGIAQFVEIDTDSLQVSIEYNDKGEAVIKQNSLEIVGVSIANETSLQEVQDTTYLSAAEAIYEKDMRKINQKETQIDTKLEKLEAERTAIKTEQDDLKKVIQDNVDLTFKLFS